MADEPHPEVQAFLEGTADAPAWHTMSAAEARRRHRAVALPGPEYEPEPVENVTDTTVRGEGHGIAVRAYEPAEADPGATLVWAHGGGMVLGDVDTEDPTARFLANRSGCTVLSVDYRMAPEHPFPAALTDVLAVTEWAAEHADAVGGDPDRLVVGGSSAGANLAAATALVVRDRGGPDIDYQVLGYPSVSGRDDFDSLAAYDGYFLESEDSAFFTDCYLPHELHGANPYANPLAAADHSGLPDATVITAGFDPLQDEGIAYAEALDAGGAAVEHHHYDDVIHAFLGMVAPEPWERTIEAHEQIGADLRSHFG